MCGVGLGVDISVGVTGEEISSGDGVGEVFCAVGESCFNASELRDVVDGCEFKGVGGGGSRDAVSDVVGECDGAVEVIVRSECPAITSGV